MRTAEGQQNRRRYTRFPLGLPVRMDIPGRLEPVIVEMVDISAGGIRLRALEDGAPEAERVRLRFVLPDQHACVAGGLVARAQRNGEFALILDQTNDAFRCFLASLAAERL
jgi:PilZ domain-containing protein